MNTKLETASSIATHEVFNQARPLVDFNLFTEDIVMVDGLHRHGASWAYDRVSSFGQRMGSSEVLLWAEQANRVLPVLKTHDRYGHRIDEVEFHPAWHNLMSLSVESGLTNLPWGSKRDGAHVARAAMMFLAYQTEAGHCCPISMTYSVVPALRKQPDLSEIWEPRILSNGYDGRLIKSQDKPGVIFGMAMTEKQGGSDVRANTTKAAPVDGGGPGKEYLITGHKWFCSAPMSDAFLILAQAGKGLSCFLVPRILDDGTRNRFFIQRLKDKLGNKSNASSEIEFRDTLGFLVGEEGRGVQTIIEMVNHTRLDCAIGSASLMRQATLQAVHHCAYRSAFGKRLIEQPAMLNVLADLAIESEAATLMMLRLAESYDQAVKSSEQSVERRTDTRSTDEQAFKRIFSAIAKYWLCKRAPVHVAEGLECLGGAGYVEEGVMPRLFRESPLNSIWEGSGNVIALDVLRAIAKEPGCVEGIRAELSKTEGSDARYDRYIASVVEQLESTKAKVLSAKDAAEMLVLEGTARRLVERIALALQASLVLRYSPVPVVDAFIASRLDGDRGMSFGTLSAATKFDEIIGRVRTV